MAVDCGSFSLNSSAGTQSITGVGFQPVAVLFFTIEGGLGDPSNMLGCMDANGNQWLMWTGLDDQTSTYDRRYREVLTDRCINVRAQPDFTSNQCHAEFQSMDSDGFTIDVITGGNPVVISFMAIGGDHIGNARAGTFAVGASTGTTAITGIGFQPRALICAHVFHPTLDAVQIHASWGLGFADDQLNQYSCYGLAQQSAAVDGTHIHRTDAVACGFFAGNSYYTALDSMDSDGFTLDVLDAHGSNLGHGYLAIDADAAAVGNGVQPDSTGTATFTTGFEPGGVMFGWNGADTPSTTGSTTMPVRPGVGWMDGTNQATVSFIHRASAPFGAYVPNAYFTTTGAIQMAGQGSQVDPGANDDRCLAAFDSFSGEEFTIEWTTVADTNDRAFGWLALPGELPVLDMSRRYGHP